MWTRKRLDKAKKGRGPYKDRGDWSLHCGASLLLGCVAIVRVSSSERMRRPGYLGVGKASQGGCDTNKALFWPGPLEKEQARKDSAAPRTR